MTHARQQIREAVATILSRNPVAWKSVLKQRMEPDRVLWPYLLVFDTPETSDPSTVSDPCIYAREMTLITKGMLRLPGTGDMQTIEVQMDDLAGEIEVKLTQSTLRASIVQIQSLYLAGTDKDIVERETETGITYHAEVVLSWRISYATEEGSPEAFY